MREVASTNISKYYEIKSLKENKNNYEINIYYPHTKIEKLNNYIILKIQEYINNFKIQIEARDFKHDSEKYSLNITFDVEEAKQYISLIFHIEENVKNVHPESYICTINYNKKTDKIIDINELEKICYNIIINISKYSYQELIKNERIKKYGAYSILELGTKATKKNYRNFVISDSNITIYFEQKQIAPYVLGEFKITIPFEKIGIKKI